MTYTTISGDEWDMICFKHYGNEHLMHEVMNANPEHMHIVVFPAGIQLNMPDVVTEQTATDLPPWMVMK